MQNLKQFFCTSIQPLSEMTVKGQEIGIERAPEPDEIHWENTGITQNGSICRKVSYGLISFMVLFLGGWGQYWLFILSARSAPESKIFFRLFNPCFVLIWNSIIGMVIIKLTEKERN